jgi:hypothetical protein
LARSDVHYCSKRCFGLGKTGANNPAYRGGTVTLQCQWCGNPHVQKQGAAKRVKCCSQACATNLRWHTDAFGTRKLLTMRACKHCKKQFKPFFHGSQYCDKTCASAAHAYRMQGKGNGRYVHGQALRKYPPGWTRTHKAQIRARDGDCCQICGRGPDGNRALDVHHINYDKADLQPGNLITLCRFCHGKMHGNKKSRARWKRELFALLKRSGERTLFPMSASPHATTTSPTGS